MARTYYHTSSTGSSTTTNTAYQDKATLTFTPTSGKVYAIFMSALISNTNTADYTYVRILDDTNTAVLYEAYIEPRDTTDELSVTGVGIFTAASGSSHTFKVQYATSSGGTAGIQDVYLTALELVDTDYSSSTTGSFSVTGGSGGVDGDDEYDTLNEITVDAGSYLIVGSASYSDTSTAAGTTTRPRLLVWDDTNNAAYGYIQSSYKRDGSQYQPYWYVMAVAPGSSTNYDLRAGEDYGTGLTVQYRTILALDRTAVRQTYSAHAENIQNSTSTSDTVADSVTVTLDNSGNNLILASWFGAHEDTATSWYSNIQLNGTDIYTSDISVEPENGDATPSFNGDDANWCCGFAGIQNMSSGSNTVRVVWYTENGADTASIARVNVSGLDVDSSLGFEWYVKNSGSWKAAESFYVKHSGTWKAATGLYVKSGGAWKSLLNEPEFTGENVDATSSEYTSVFPNVPSPSPVSPVGGCCFLPGSLIAMADGTFKAIENVLVGDLVKGRWGINKVLGLDIPVLGDRPIWNINNEVFNTADHLTWTERGWAVIGMEEYLANDYQQLRPVKYSNDSEERQMWLYEGIDPKNVYEFNLGDKIAHSDGWKDVKSLEPVTMDPDTVLYALVTDGDHTIHVNGYVFAGWPSDKDFDYDSRIGT